MMKTINKLLKTIMPPFKINCAPIFVLGKEKSGTTVIAALLAKCANQTVTLDLPRLWGPMETRIHSGEVRFSDFVQNNRRYFSRDIIKEPCLTFLYSELKRAFPQAKYLMIVRDPRDNIRSILNRLGIHGNLENIDANTFSKISPGWQVVLDGRWLGLQGDTYIEMAAARWNYAVDVYLEHDNEMVLVRYEDFVADKIGMIKNLARQLGIPQAHDISDSINIQYQPSGNRSISWEEFFGRENLLRIERICGGRMKTFGYQIE
jgi:Sulfotransferase family